jgi:hypothetical protein
VFHLISLRFIFSLLQYDLHFVVLLVLYFLERLLLKSRDRLSPPPPHQMMFSDTSMLLPSRSRERRGKCIKQLTLSCQGPRSRNLLALITGLAIFNYRCWWLWGSSKARSVCLSAEFQPIRRHWDDVKAHDIYPISLAGSFPRTLDENPYHAQLVRCFVVVS